jgi:hypothetical protein
LPVLNKNIIYMISWADTLNFNDFKNNGLNLSNNMMNHVEAFESRIILSILISGPPWLSTTRAAHSSDHVCVGLEDVYLDTWWLKITLENKRRLCIPTSSWTRLWDYIGLNYSIYWMIDRHCKMIGKLKESSGQSMPVLHGHWYFSLYCPSSC